MFVPIGDDNPLKVIPFQYVTVTLIALNIFIFLLELGSGSEGEVASSFAVVPRELFAASLDGGPLNPEAVPVPERATLLSYMFFHGDAMHLLGNMLFLWVFGDNVEDELGHLRFLFFFLACGIAAALLHAVIIPESGDPLIGASGAISGVIAAYLILHPRVGIWVLVAKFIPLKITAAWALGAWIVFQIVMAFMPTTGEAISTAWWAHIGGLLAGALLIVIMRRSKMPPVGSGPDTRN